jgi:hypothetical protein
MQRPPSLLCRSPLSAQEEDDQSRELLFEEISQYFHYPLEEVCFPLLNIYTYYLYILLISTPCPSITSLFFLLLSGG